MLHWPSTVNTNSHNKVEILCSMSHFSIITWAKCSKQERKQQKLLSNLLLLLSFIMFSIVFLHKTSLKSIFSTFYILLWYVHPRLLASFLLQCLLSVCLGALLPPVDQNHVKLMLQLCACVWCVFLCNSCTSCTASCTTTDSCIDK